MLGDRFKKMLSVEPDRASVREEMSAKREELLAQTKGTVPIGKLQERQVAKIFGLLQSITLPAPGTPGPFMATVFDGTGAIDIIWLGRRSIPGIDVGSHIIVKGTVARHGGGLCMMNPEYRLTDDA